MSSKGKGKQKQKKSDEGGLDRLAIISTDRCRPKKCRLDCKRYCPVNRQGRGKMCVEVTQKNKIAVISEDLCIGCGICVKKCPFEALSIVRLPTNIQKETTHRFGRNSFKLHRLPIPRPNQVLGLVGTNGIGKTTALRVLAGKEKPNLGEFDNPPDWEEIVTNFRGSELQAYFTKLVEDQLRAVVKPQYVDAIPKKLGSSNVGKILQEKDELGCMKQMISALDLQDILERKVEELSGGELQRFALAVASMMDVDIYLYDEPSSYLDVKQRLKAARVIRERVEIKDDEGETRQVYVVVVEHDLSVLDYMSDYVCVLYGKPGAFGVVTKPFSVKEGINIFLAGFVPTENLRFRTDSLSFKIANVEEDEESLHRHFDYDYPRMEKTLGDFHLDIDKGNFADSEIVVLVGENGTGKTTFIQIMAGKIASDNDAKLPEMDISYKPQKIAPKFQGTVLELLNKRVSSSLADPQFEADVLKPMNVESLYDKFVQNLSGGELQRVALVLCLGTPADIYLIDEPSAYLDSEQRILAARVIKRYIFHKHKTAFVVEHDFIMSIYLADRMIVFEGEPSVKCQTSPPQTLVSGMNTFLKSLDITFRRDPTNYRPRINKHNSVKDREQKLSGDFFHVDE